MHDDFDASVCLILLAYLVSTQAYCFKIVKSFTNEIFYNKKIKKEKRQRLVNIWKLAVVGKFKDKWVSFPWRRKIWNHVNISIKVVVWFYPTLFETVTCFLRNTGNLYFSFLYQTCGIVGHKFHLKYITRNIWGYLFRIVCFLTNITEIFTSCTMFAVVALIRFICWFYFWNKYLLSKQLSTVKLSTKRTRKI